MIDKAASKVVVVRGTRVAEAARALSSEARVGILEILRNGPRSISQLAAELSIAQPAVTNHVRMLEQAGLLKTYQGTGERGVTKMCCRTYDEVRLQFSHLPEPPIAERIPLTMPVGCFSRCGVHPTCGLASAESLIGYYDDPRSFYLSDRFKADILWFGWGFVEYDFPNPLLVGQTLESVVFTAEMCSEAPGYDANYPSEITFSVNGREVGTWVCPGDLGDKRGLLNPPWWPETNTQYGYLKALIIDRDGVRFDGVRVSAMTVDEVVDRSKPAITVGLEVKENAHYRGGLTLFGKSFGNYRQELSLTVVTNPVIGGVTPSGGLESGAAAGSNHQSTQERGEGNGEGDGR